MVGALAIGEQFSRLERRGFLNRDEGDRILVPAALPFRQEICPEVTVLNFMLTRLKLWDMFNIGKLL